MFYAWNFASRLIYGYVTLFQRITAPKTKQKNTTVQKLGWVSKICFIIIII